MSDIIGSKFDIILPGILADTNPGEKIRWKETILKELKMCINNENWVLMMSTIGSIRKYMRVAEFSFTREDLSKILKLLLELFFHEKLPVKFHAVIMSCICGLFRKGSGLLDDIVLEIEPFVERFKNYYFFKSRIVEVKTCHKVTTQIYFGMIKRLRNYFTLEDGKQMIRKLLIHKNPFNARVSMKYQIFLCRHYPTIHATNELLDFIFSQLLDIDTVIWEREWIYFLSVIARNNIGLLIWKEEYIRQLFTILLRSFCFPIGKRFRTSEVGHNFFYSLRGRDFKEPTGIFQSFLSRYSSLGFIFMYIWTPKNHELLLSYFRKFFRVIRSFLNPQKYMKGLWLPPISLFFANICSDIIRRTRLERKKKQGLKKRTVYSNIPEEAMLTETMIKDLVSLVFGVVQEMIPSNNVKVTTAVSSVINCIAFMDSSLVFEKSDILKKNVELLGYFLEPYKMYSSTVLVSNLMLPLIMKNKKLHHETATHCLEIILEGIDLNQLKRAKLLVVMISEMFNSISLFSEEEAECMENIPAFLLDIKGWLGSFLDLFLELEDTATSESFGSNSSGKSDKRFVASGIRGIFYLVFKSLSPELLNIVIEKALQVLKSPTYVGKYNHFLRGIIKQAGRKSNANCKLFFDALFSKLMDSKTMELNDLQDRELSVIIRFLTGLFSKNQFTLEFVDPLLIMIDKIWIKYCSNMKEKSTRKKLSVGMGIVGLVSSVCFSMNQIYDIPLTITCFDHRKWGSQYSKEDFSKEVKYHFPSDEEIEACVKIYNHFIPSACEKIVNFIKEQKLLLKVNKEKEEIGEEDDNDDGSMKNGRGKKMPRIDEKKLDELYVSFSIILKLVDSCREFFTLPEEQKVGEYTRKRYETLDLNNLELDMEITEKISPLLKVSKLELIQMVTEFMDTLHKSSLDVPDNLLSRVKKVCVQLVTNLFRGGLTKTHNILKGCSIRHERKRIYDYYDRPSGYWNKAYYISTIHPMISARKKYFKKTPYYDIYSPLVQCILKFCYSRFVRRRIIMKNGLLKLVRSFSKKFIKDLIVPSVFEILKLPSPVLFSEENQGKLEGMLEFLSMNKIVKVILGNWKMKKEFLSLLVSFSPKKSIHVNHRNQILSGIFRRLRCSEKSLSEGDGVHEDEFISFLSSKLEDSKIEWRESINILNFVFSLIRSEKVLPISLVKSFVGITLISDVNRLRKSTIAILNIIFAQLKPKQPKKKIVIHSFEEFQKHVSFVPNSREDYKKTVFIDKPGKYYERSLFSESFELEFPNYEFSPERSKDTNNIEECLKLFFYDHQFLSSFFKNCSDDVLSGHVRIQFFKGLFQILPYSEFLDHIEKPFEELLKKHLGSKHQDVEKKVTLFSYHLLGGLFLAFKHWNYDTTQNKGIPFFLKFFGIIMRESKADLYNRFHNILSTLFHARDNRRLFFLFEYLYSGIWSNEIDMKRNKYLDYFAGILSYSGWRDSIAGNHAIRFINKLVSIKSEFLDFLVYEKFRMRITFLLRTAIEINLNRFYEIESTESSKLRNDISKIFGRLISVFSELLEKEEEIEGENNSSSDLITENKAEILTVSKTILSLISRLFSSPLRRIIFSCFYREIIDSLFFIAVVDDQEIQKDIRGCFVGMSRLILDEKTFSISVSYLMSQIIQNRSKMTWRLRKVAVIIVETMFFQSMFYFSDNDEEEESIGIPSTPKSDENFETPQFSLFESSSANIRNFVLLFLNDKNVEVSTAATDALCSLICRSSKKEITQILENFVELGTNQIKRLKKLKRTTISTELLEEIKIATFVNLGCCGFILSSPHSIEWYLAEILMLVGKYKHLWCISRMRRVQQIVKNSVNSFWKTHRSEWKEKYQKFFSSSQLEIMDHLVEIPSYYI